MGVEFVKDGSLDRIEGFQKDCIISAGSCFEFLKTNVPNYRTGAFQTPQILELSGIGNQAILSEFGIQTLVDLPGVGENLRAFFRWLTHHE